MSSVASNMVATLMNSQSGANQTFSINAAPSDNTFQNILNNSGNYQKLDRKAYNDLVKEKKGTTVETTEVDQPTEEVKVTTTDKEVSAKEPEFTEETSTIEEKVEVVEEEMASEVKELTEDSTETEAVLEERLEALEEIMLDFIGDLLGVEPEALESMMTDMGMTPVELMDMENITAIVTEFFGLDSFSELLVNEEATQTLREIGSTLQTALEDIANELEVEVETVRTMIESGMADTTGTTEVNAAIEMDVKPESQVQSTVQTAETVEQTTEEVKLEVVDERTGSDTTKYSHDNTGKEEQSFAGLLSGNAEMTKEVVVVNNGNQVVYKEISAGEVIDQIVTKAAVKLTDAKTTMELQLNPGNLGKIGVQVTSEQGLVKGQFVAENQVVKEMIELNLTQLKEQLEEQGIKVDKIEVTVGNSNQFFDGQKQQQQQSEQSKSNRRRINRLSRMRNISEVVDFLNEDAEVHIPQLNTLTEHTVNYSA